MSVWDDTKPELLDHFVEIAYPEVHVTDTNPRLAVVVSRAAAIHYLLFGKALLITSGNDGKHANHSKHYVNLAVDLRTKDKTPVENFLFLMILVYVAEGYGCAVFDERTVAGEPHFHVELSG